jgi:vitamin B12 transporter
MPRLSHSISLAALALATAAHAQSQSAQFTADPRVDTVVVTATRVPTPTQNVASSITVFTADDIAAKQEQTLPGVLQDAPGLNVVQTGGPGGQTSVFMRGTNSNHVKVLVDGIDVGDPSSPNGAFDFGQFLTPDIARVEILRGPQSGLYGSDAVGGVINVITKSGEGPPRIAAGLEGGSFATFNQDGSILGSTGPFHYSADIEHFHSGATPVTPLDLLLPGERRIDDDYDNVTASTKLGYDVTSDFALGLVARYTDTHLKFTGENEDDYPNDFPDMSQTESDTRQYYIRGSGRLSLFGGRFEQTLGVAYGDIRTTTLSPDFGTSQDAGDRFKIDWQGNLNIARRSACRSPPVHPSIRAMPNSCRIRSRTSTIRSACATTPMTGSAVRRPGGSPRPISSRRRGRSWRRAWEPD